MIKNLKFRVEQEFALCDFSNPMHTSALANLINQYMSDPMGNHPMHNEKEDSQLIEALKNHPTSITLFILEDNKPVGIINAFMNLSTFNIRPYIYIHDVFIMPEYRGRGLSKKLISKMIQIAKDNNCCKLALEVRHDNPAAQACYKAAGFKDDVPLMYYWEKLL